MDLEIKLPLDDAVYWAKLVDEKLIALIALCDELDTKLDKFKDPAVYELSIDANKLSIVAAGIRSRNQHILSDLGLLQSKLDPSTT